MSKLIDLTGQTFGRLTVIERAENDRWGHARWLCQCSCEEYSTVASNELRGKKTKSCGCLQKEAAHNAKIIHGKTNTSEYQIWLGIIKRCTNPKENAFKNYGGRGITICNEWRNDFMAFFNHVGPRPSRKYTIERIDNDGNYEPGNLKWASVKEQNNNSRNNHYLTFDNQTNTLTQWSKITTISISAISGRIRAGWSIGKTLTENVRPLRARPIMFNGKTQNIRQWAEEYGIKRGTLAARLDRGWSIEKALGTPVYNAH